MKEQVLFQVMSELEQKTNLQARWYEDAQDNQIDGTLQLSNGYEQHLFPAIFKKDIKPVALVALQETKESFSDLIVIADIIYPTIKERLRELGINYADSAGNCYIRKGNWHFMVDGLRSEPLRPVLKEKTFTKTALILIFHFLNDSAYLNTTYRQIAEDYDTALGNVNKIINSLKEQGYVQRTNEKLLVINNREKLLEEWVTGYHQKLKPTIFLGQFRFANEYGKDWTKLPLGLQNQWGGEPAADILTGYLKPAELTLYTTEKKVDLIKKYKLIPGNGNLFIYKKFWKFPDKDLNVVPTMLIYSDLISTGDPRNLETARKLYDGLFEN
ncbi:type IV toxin-antitoxin system AbiEi family antitoxin [Pedobacter nanyangensis]|uniref:type IV toxin-antitoxin system AbiEi family antitoxin n=1 Tax=Pedobacter nanyangensis TaxID=1562389 RepID=UPI000DE23B9B|nr:type IV toxin-antitoxin system AbiEi family antitoxin [Pedobacter nanyangensis]